jgi:SAM-dependent methyltransferase
MPLWLQSPPGRYLLEWEQARVDAHVADVFGFHALQLGMPEIDGLRANRMPHRWLAHATLDERLAGPSAADAPHTRDTTPRADIAPIETLYCDFSALPFPNQSLDLVVLPHTLEFAADPHQTLREVERVLVADGRIVVLGFNPHSLWGARQWAGRWSMRLGGGQAAAPLPKQGDARGPGQGSVHDQMPLSAGLFMPRSGDFIALRRLRDWLRLLDFEVERGGFGCYRPALRSQAWLDRYAWMEKAGDRWWPMFGAVYLLSAVKRVRGLRVINPRRRKVRAPRTAPAVASHTHRSGEDRP